jgi:signal transduction histidine kinase
MIDGEPRVDQERIVVDLQDNLIQRLFAIGMLVESVRRRLDSSGLQAKLDQATRELDATIKHTREALRLLRASADPDHPALRQRMLAAIKEATGRAAVNPSVHLDGPLDALVPPEIADDAVKIIRTAVADAVRHGATTISITVVARDTLAVTVAADVPSTPADDWLRSAAAHAAEYGGNLTMADDGPGGRLRWQVPLS